MLVWLMDRTVRKSAGCYVFKGEKRCQEQIVLLQGTDDIERSYSRPRVTMVPGAALLKPQKTQLQRLDYMPIVIVDKGNVNSDVCGF